MTHAKPQTSALPNIQRTLVLLSLAASVLLAYGFWRQANTPTQARHKDRANPWAGLPGCLWLGTGSQQRLWPLTAADTLACGLELGRTPDLLDEALRPPHSRELLNSLQPWLAAPPQARPGVATAKPQAAASQATADDDEPASLIETTSPAPRLQTQGRGQHSYPVQQGHSIHLSLNLSAQAQAQTVANCMTGKTSDCGAAGIPEGRWSHQHENAGARMAALIQIDLPSGEIEAMAHAGSPCHNADAAAAAPPADCPQIAHAKANARQLQNQDFYAEQRLGSTVKLPEILTLLRSDIGPGLQQGAGRQWVLNALKTSDTQGVLDKLFCKDKNFAADCRRTTGLAQAAQDLALAGQPLFALLGHKLGQNSAQDPGLKLPGARAFMQLTQGQRQWQPLKTAPTRADLRRECSARQWRQCESEQLALEVAEALGEGSTSGSPLGVAAMLNQLAAAADARPAVPLHLARSIQTGNGTLLPSQGQTPSNINPAHARLILQGMALSHTGGHAGSPQPGTAHSACIDVFGSAQACNAIKNIAGKTATPGFAHKLLSWQQRDELCQKAHAIKAEAGSYKALSPHTKSILASCGHAPVKWYLALVKSSTQPDAPYTKAIVVLAERNWVKTTGLVDSPLDRGSPNIAAEVAMRYLKISGLVTPPSAKNH